MNSTGRSIARALQLGRHHQAARPPLPPLPKGGNGWARAAFVCDRPLPRCVVRLRRKSDSAAFKKHADFAALCKSYASESDSPARRAGRGLKIIR